MVAYSDGRAPPCQVTSRFGEGLFARPAAVWRIFIDSKQNPVRGIPGLIREHSTQILARRLMATLCK
ncbi:hypothetical protein BGLA2_2170034 [Burkholderia gladioli]|nr:hypothetical protein BGLA2_2170034 [Burkholderia gladioli]